MRVSIGARRLAAALAIALTLLAAAPAEAAPEPPTAAPPLEVPDSLGLSPEGRQAALTLARAAHFGGWAVGAAGAPTAPVEAWRVLRAEPEAAAAFRFVLANGTLAGQLMALAGLWEVDRPAFDEAVARYRGLRDPVRLETSGCVPGGPPVPASQIVERADAVRLDGPRDDIAAWSRRNPGKPIEFDLVGGGYSAVFRKR